MYVADGYVQQISGPFVCTEEGLFDTREDRMVLLEKGITDILLVGDKLFYIQENYEKNEVHICSLNDFQHT